MGPEGRVPLAQRADRAARACRRRLGIEALIPALRAAAGPAEPASGRVEQQREASLEAPTRRARARASWSSSEPEASAGRGRPAGVEPPARSAGPVVEQQRAVRESCSRAEVVALPRRRASASGPGQGRLHDAARSGAAPEAAPRLRRCRAARRQQLVTERAGPFPGIRCPSSRPWPGACRPGRGKSAVDRSDEDERGTSPSSSRLRPGDRGHDGRLQAGRGRLASPRVSANRAPKAEQEAPRSSPSAQEANDGKGHLAEGLGYAERAVELSPRDVGYRMLLADLYLKNGRFQSAETTFGDVVSLDPSPTPTRAGCGRRRPRRTSEPVARTRG